MFINKEKTNKIKNVPVGGLVEKSMLGERVL